MPDHNAEFLEYKQRLKTVSSVTELLPGLNDIADAFEALPMDLVKYFTLLKEIDAKCIGTMPRLHSRIDDYVARLHADDVTEFSRAKDLKAIQRCIQEVIPSLEEKMHVLLVAADVVAKHMQRINNDYSLIVGNNEIPELVRIGPLVHSAMVNESAEAKLAHSARSESRREALAARKATKEDDEDGGRKRRRETTPFEKKKRRDEEKTVERRRKPRADDDERQEEQTYCYCNQVSFGEMVGCDGETCQREWFHLPCIGFKNPPKGKWYCDDCLEKLPERERERFAKMRG